MSSYEDILGEVYNKHARNVEWFDDSIAVPRGALLVYNLPSESLLSLHLPEIYKGKKIGRRHVKLLADYFRTRLANMRSIFFRYILPRYAVKISRGLYLIPYTELEGFLRAVARMRRNYELLQEALEALLLRGEITEYLREKIERYGVKINQEYIEGIREYLREEIGVEDPDKVIRERLKNIDFAGRFVIRLIPCTFDLESLRENMSTSAFIEMRRRLRELALAIHRSLEEKYREREQVLLERVFVALNTELKPERIEAYLPQLYRLRAEMAAYGVDTARIDRAIEIIEMFTKGKYDKVLQEYVRYFADSARLRRLIEDAAKMQRRRRELMERL